MLNGLSLFSGIGGIDVALSEWVRPVAYCEIDPYCQGVLINRMGDGRIERSPVWDDVRTLDAAQFPKGTLDIIYGGFPCQDISVAGHGKGLEGERSGLFFEIVRLAKEIKPKFIFLENVPAITSRGGLRVVREIAEMGYDCRWCCISAASVGAPHKRERWFLLAHAHDDGLPSSKIDRSSTEGVCDASEGKNGAREFKGVGSPRDVATESIAHSTSMRCNEGASKGIYPEWETIEHEEYSNVSSSIPICLENVAHSTSTRCPRRRELPIGNATTYAIAADENISSYWQETESPLCGMDDGVPNRVDRIRGLGNAVVPVQVKEAFEILMGIYGSDG